MLHRIYTGHAGVITDRLLGTEVSLIGATTSSTCGTINSVNTNGGSIEDQSYSVFCPATTEPSIAVKLYDDYTTSSDYIIMNIAEVKVYELSES